jgi:hypothetical protein
VLPHILQERLCRQNKCLTYFLVVKITKLRSWFEWRLQATLQWQFQ